MSKRGRPKLPDSERRDIARIFLFNEHEDRFLTSLAEQYDVSMATIVRWSVASIYELEQSGYTDIDINEFK